MGIPRLTQDLTPYLESAVFASKGQRATQIRLQNVVIDGPSLVFFVSNRLTSYTSTLVPAADGLAALPTYAQISDGVRSFLEDLEACGAIVKNIFFDGSLPTTKRPTRIQRLERARAGLAAQRQLTPGWKRVPVLSRRQISEAIWRKSTVSQHSDLAQQPFMVPAVIEELAKSRWNSITHVVPDEAESYCAPAARREDACVLTNDSDLLLYEDLATDTGVIVLLNSLEKQAGLTQQPVNSIVGTCWRPKHIASQIGLKSLLQLGYARFREPHASYLTVRQVAKDIRSGHTPFDTFATPFRTRTAASDSSFASTLQGLDPRLAEVVTQFGLQSGNNVQYDIYSTLPVLLEDPTRDAAWSYGRDFRSVAYSLISQHHYGHIEAVSQWEGHQVKKPVVTEAYRRGQNIAFEDSATMSASAQQEIIASFNQAWHVYFGGSDSMNRSSIEFSLLPALAHWLIGLHIVLEHRAHQEKPPFPSIVIMQFLGLISPELANPRICGSREDSGGWTLVHLSACVQAVLYSFRMLRQAARFVARENDGPLKDLNLHISPRPNLIDDPNISMPLLADLAIKDVFLDPFEISECFKQAPAEAMRHPLEAFTEVHAFHFERRLFRQSAVIADPKPREGEAPELWETKKHKRQKHGDKSLGSSTVKAFPPASASQRPKNLYEILNEL